MLLGQKLPDAKTCDKYNSCCIVAQKISDG
uniref:Uncharacterized protein n=1 Tax=Anguilla anguilla TaxID=7936 RepID=A0A0E9UNV8_ANGAN